MADVSTGSPFRNPDDSVIRKFRLEGLVHVDFRTLSQLFVSLLLKGALQLCDLS
jgi:hypothetical protein